MKLTKSDFINSLLESYVRGLNSFYKTALENKSKVGDDYINILIYNTIMNKNNDTDNLIVADPDNTFSNEYSRIMKDNVECYHGKTKNSYSEFLRAFCKLTYRLFNDGDSVFFGPYSALNFYLSKTDGVRQFSFYETGFVSFDIYQNDFDKDKMEESFNELILYLLMDKNHSFWPDMIDCISNRFKNHDQQIVYNIRNWIDTIVVMLDQLTDDIKGVKSEYFDDCSKYYKNMLEYKDEKTYNFFCNQFNINQWSGQDFNEECCDTFQDGKEFLDLDIARYDNKYCIRFNPRMHHPSIYMKVPFELGVQNEDLDNLMRFYNEVVKYNKIVSMNANEFIKYKIDISNYLNKNIKIIKVIKNENDDSYKDDQVLFDGILSDFQDKELASKCIITSIKGFNGYSDVQNVLKVTVKETEGGNN